VGGESVSGPKQTFAVASIGCNLISLAGVRMRLFLLCLGLGLASCARLESPSRSEDALQACVISVRFTSEQGRAHFTQANAAALRSMVDAHSGYAITSDDAPEQIDFVVPTRICNADSIRQHLQFDDASIASIAVLEVSEDDAQERMLAPHRTTRDENFRWACVVRREPSDFNLSRNDFSYVALRTPQVEWANDALYVASNDGCTTLAVVLEQRLSGENTTPSTDTELCQNSSLVQCGYPANIHIWPRG
jgi:hypothetical protein